MTRSATPRYAAIDLGSHSAKLTVAEFEAEREAGRWRPILERVEITGLGRGDPRRHGLDPEARRRTLAVLEDFARLLRRQRVSAVAAVATAVLRQASDAATFLDELRERSGLPLEVISGEDEARLTYLGAVGSLPALRGGGCQLAFDIGGASTELAWGDGPEPHDRRSLDLGTIALAGVHGLAGAVAPQAIAAAQATLATLLDTLPDLPPPDRLVAIGATPATLLALHLGREIADSAEVHGAALSREVIAAQVDRLRRLAAPERRALPGLHPGRAEVVLAGAVITAAVAARWASAPVLVSARGLRTGLLQDRFAGRP